MGAYARRNQKKGSQDRGQRKRTDLTGAFMTKHQAQCSVREAVRRGELIKPTQCQDCGIALAPRLLAGHHHKGYERPLDVIWLCQKCHSKAHYVKRPNAFYSYMKLHDADVLEIVRLRKSGRSLREVAEKYGVTVSHVSHICRGKRFLYLQRDPMFAWKWKTIQAASR